jgi:uncharacterized delta-60 repeat protein
LGAGARTLAILLLALWATAADSAGERRWVRTYGGFYAGGDTARGIAIDKNDNILMAGHSFGGAETYYDYAVAKISPGGVARWVRRWSGPSGYDEPYGIAVDKNGNAIVTGKSIGTRGIGLPDIVTIKLDAAGVLQWERRWFGGTSAHEEGRAVTTDAAGNIYVAGKASSASASNTYEDAVLLKYSAAGDLRWVRTYDAPMHDNDGYFSVAVDGDGNVFAAGFSTQNGINLQDFLVVKYNPYGVLQWRRTYNGEEDFDDWAESIAVDKDGNALVTGSRGESCGQHCYSFATIKYSPAGVRQWVKIYDPEPTSDDLAHAVKADRDGNVYVTGQSSWKSAFYDFATVKYAPDGRQLWVRRYDGPGQGEDIPYSLAVDSQGNAVVAGHSHTSLEAGSDIATLKYSPTGALQWARRYGGTGSGEDRAFFVKLDSADNVYTSGFTTGGATEAEDCIVIKYAP